MGKKKEWVGEHFGRWTVIGIDYKNPLKVICQCSCKLKTTKSVAKNNLRNNKSKSCGCIHKEQSAINGKLNRKHNKYDLSGKYGVGFTNNGYEFYFDLEDYDLIYPYCWHKHQDGYLRTRYDCIDGKNKYILMHNLIMNGFNKSILEVDHINGKPNDNQKSNMRKVTHAQNMKNQKFNSANKSGTIGVVFEKRSKKWKAYISVDNKRINLGTFSNLEDAITARKNAELKYHGEFIRAEEDKFNGTR